MVVAASALALLLAGCAPLPQRATIATSWLPSPNFDQRRPSFVVLHHTSNDSVEPALRALTDPSRAVSVHYLVGRDGAIYQLVDESARAWHAGESYWGGDTDLNSSSLGIELDNNGAEPFAAPQIVALLALLADIQQRYRIPAANFLGHADIAPKRKVDPSRYFPWPILASHGFGVWCDPPLPEPQSPFDSTLALRAMGYDVSDVGAAIRAFKLHFVPDDTAAELTNHDRSVLYCLLMKRVGQ